MLMTFECVDFDWIEREDGRVAVGVDEVVILLDGNIAHVSRYVKDVFPDYKFQWSGGTVGRSRWYVYEPGVYQLLFSSSLAKIAPEKVEKFQRWMFEKVLPDIRKNSVYISPEATKEDIISAAQERGIELALELNDQQALLTYNAQLQNRCIDFDSLEQEWLSISQVLEKRGYKLSNKAIDVSLAQVGKQVKKAYIEATGKDPKITVKQVGSNHGTEIKSYPADWFNKIEEIALSYWSKKGIQELAN